MKLLNNHEEIRQHLDVSILDRIYGESKELSGEKKIDLWNLRVSLMDNWNVIFKDKKEEGNNG